MQFIKMFSMHDTLEIDSYIDEKVTGEMFFILRENVEIPVSFESGVLKDIIKNNTKPELRRR